MARFAVGHAAEVMGGRLTAGDPQAVASGAALDTRKISGGEIFFAFAGARADGHDFVADALARGAAAAVVTRPVTVEGSAGAVIEVADAQGALHALARHARQSGVPGKLAGITGSAGKTTTKEILAALLATRFRTAKTLGNLNNLLGFPLSLLNVPEGTEWMVAEMGMSTPGELRQLSLLGRPDVAVFTVVRPVHLEFFSGVEAIAEAKAELLAGVPEGGFAVANAGDPQVARIARRFEAEGGEVVWYGLDTAADISAMALSPAPGEGVGSRFRLNAEGEEQAIQLPLHGLYNVENFLAAAATAWALGVTLAEIAAAAESLEPAAGRGVVHRAAAGFTVVDDSYNSNPDAAGKALAGARTLEAERRIAILGDMLELGPTGPAFHEEVGREAARLGFSPVVGVGPLSRDLAGAAAAEGAEAIWLADAAAAASWAAEHVLAGDLVLVKGSRGVGLDAVVGQLLSLPRLPRLAVEVGG